MKTLSLKRTLLAAFAAYFVLVLYSCQKETSSSNTGTVVTEEQATTVKSIFDKAINKPAYKVELESLSPDELPVTITMDEFMRRMKDMAAMGGGMGFYGSMPDNYKVVVNGNHKLITRILQEENVDTQAQLSKQAFDLALLSQGLLTGAELTEFVNRSVNLI